MVEPDAKTQSLKLWLYFFIMKGDQQWLNVNIWHII